MTRTKRILLHSAQVAAVAAIAGGTLLAAGGSPAMASQGNGGPSCNSSDFSDVCNPSVSGVNLREGTNTSAKIIVQLPAGTGLFIDCQTFGQQINGPWGTSKIWDHVTWTSFTGSVTGYVSDTYVYTGTGGLAFPQC